MSFHPHKCSVLSATRKRQTAKASYQQHGHTLTNVNKVKSLGITITSDSARSSHISDTGNKTNKTLGFLRWNMKIGNRKIKETAYKSLVRPVLEYASSIWDPHTTKGVIALEKIQRRAARWETGQPSKPVERKHASVCYINITQVPSQLTHCTSPHYPVHDKQTIGTHMTLGMTFPTTYNSRVK